MAYYNRDGKILIQNRNNLEYLGSGAFANVLKYKNEDIICKKYFRSYLDCRLQPEIFDIIKYIDDDHFIKIYDIYQNMSLKRRINRFIVDAYTAKYYESDSTNILTQPIDFLLDNVRELERLFNTFTSNSIQTDDVKKENTVINANAIVITDPDCFYISDLEQSPIKMQNLGNLKDLIEDICVDSIMSACEDYNNFNLYEVEENIKNEFASICIEENTNFTHELSKRLGKVKRTIDFFSKTRR